jgi:DNA repair exonuclease SbcCD ATPase subunit
MGSSQSKTETVYSRYPAESEIYTGIKLTPTVVDRIANPPTAFPEATPVANVDVDAIKAEARNEVAAQLNEQLVEKLGEAESTIRAELDADYSQKLNEIKAELESDYYNRLDEIAKMNEAKSDENATIVTEVSPVLEATNPTLEAQKADLAEAEQKIQNMNLQLEQTEAVIKAAHEEADRKISQSNLELERQRSELNELQRRETEKLMERTKIIFDARLSERPICPDIEQSLAQCYSENPTRSLLCAELTRQYQNCLADEKEKYFQARVNPSSN